MEGKAIQTAEPILAVGVEPRIRSNNKAQARDENLDSERTGRGATYDERLRDRLSRCGPDAVEAAIALMERYDPGSIEEARKLSSSRCSELSSDSQEVVAEAWNRYFHIRTMSWD
ncbi:MAG: hypothetical protein JJE35_10765 [Thermoleophilia bacterium]|nr:hypothetical protein [Thermoleophilia bacterium]